MREKTTRKYYEEKGFKMNDELKPCPFCGGEAVISGCDGGDWIVICNVCDASIGDKGTEREAIEEWNLRIEPTFTPDELDAIRRNVCDWQAEREL